MLYPTELRAQWRKYYRLIWREGKYAVGGAVVYLSVPLNSGSGTLLEPDRRDARATIWPARAFAIVLWFDCDPGARRLRPKPVAPMLRCRTPVRFHSVEGRRW